MDVDYVLWLGRHTMETALMIAAPLLLTSMAVGIFVSLFQAVTSLRDTTLTMVPKLLAISVAGLVFGNWMLQILMKFTVEVFNQMQIYGQ